VIAKVFVLSNMECYSTEPRIISTIGCFTNSTCARNSL